MDKSDLQSYRRKLEKLAARMQHVAQAITEQALSPSGGHGLTELSNVPMHLGDVGTDEYLHDLNATLLENEGFLLSEVKAALARIDEGTYGYCQGCGGKIARARLEALPYTRYCIHCAATRADAPEVNLNAGRPRSPADTLSDEDEMEITRRDEQAALTDMVSKRPPGRVETRFISPHVPHDPEADIHAVGTPGGGAPIGGIAGSTKGDGAPDLP